MSVDSRIQDYSGDLRYEFIKFKKESARGHRRGAPGLSRYSSEDSEMISVLGKVKDLQIWERLTGTKYGAAIPQGKQWIVTGRIPFGKFESLKSDANVTGLRIAERCVPIMEQTKKDIGLMASTGRRNRVSTEEKGRGVIIGVVDTGAAYKHKSFMKNPMSSSICERITNVFRGCIKRPRKDETRILLIQQTEKDESGKECIHYYTQKDINEIIQKAIPYNRLGYIPREHSHGTHVMDIAAGNGGVAPEAELIFVEVNVEENRNVTEAGEKGLDFCNSQNLIEAVKFIFEEAEKINKPCVINVSLCTYLGPHDGTSEVEQAFDAMLVEKPNRAIVLAAGNSYEAKAHKCGNIAQGGKQEIIWNLPDTTYDRTMEIWYSQEDQFLLEITNEDGTLGLSIPFNSLCKLTVAGEFLGCVSNQQEVTHVGDSSFGFQKADNVIRIIKKPSQDRAWTLTLRGMLISGDGQFHAWTEREYEDEEKESERQATFTDPSQCHTLSSIATGKNTICVAAHDASKEGNSIASFSSSGPTRDERVHTDKKPDVSAPGVDICAADSRWKIHTETRIDSGTSMSAPVVTGIVAQLLELANKNKIDLKSASAHKLEVKTPRSGAPLYLNFMGNEISLTA